MISPRVVASMAEGYSSTRGTFRRQAIDTANLLLEAAERLEGSSSVERESGSDRRLQSLGRQASGGPFGRTSIVYSSSQRERERQPSGSQRASSSRSTQSSLNVGAGELRGLFNWSTRSAVGTKRKSTRYTPKSKKKRVLTWTHTYVCLAECDDSVVPDSHYRATLKLAGLGEKRFAVDIYCTGQEFYDELLYQFPKLRDGGGYELLRVPEGGGRDLDVIKVPEGGYNTEYLRAVVHSAKVFIRPLQKALDLTPAHTHIWK